MTNHLTISDRELTQFHELDEDFRAIITAGFTRTSLLIDGCLKSETPPPETIVKQLNKLSDHLRECKLMGLAYHLEEQSENLRIKAIIATEAEDVVPMLADLNADLKDIRKQLLQIAGGDSPLGSNVNLSAIGAAQPEERELERLFIPREKPISEPMPAWKMYLEKAKEKTPTYMDQAFANNLQSYLQQLKPESLEKLNAYCRGEAKFASLPISVMVGIGVELVIDKELKIATAASIKTGPTKTTEVETNFEKFQENYVAIKAELDKSQNQERDRGQDGRGGGGRGGR